MVFCIVVGQWTGLQADTAGTTTTWTGATDSSWLDSANWDNGVPQATTDVVLPDSATTKTIILDGNLLDAGKASVYNFTATDSGSGLTIQMLNNPTLVVNRDFIAANVTFEGNGTILVGDREPSSPYAGSAVFNDCTVSTGITINVSKDLTLTNTTAGTIVASANVLMTGSSVETATINGNLSQDQSSVTSRVISLGGGLTMIQNSSIARVDSVGLDVQVTDSQVVQAYQIGGSLTMNNGDLTMASTGTIGNALTLSNGSLLNGRITSVGGSVLVTDSVVNFDVNGIYQSNVTGNISLQNSTLSLSQGNLSLTGDLTLESASSMANLGRSLSVGGTTTVDATSSLTFNNAVGSFTGATTIANGGTLTWTGYNQISAQADFVNNGTFVADQNNRVTIQNGNLKLNNLGNPTALSLINLNTTNATITDTKVSFVRGDGSSFSHSGTLGLVNTTVDATTLRMDQVSMNGHTISVDGTSKYLFEALGKFSDALGVKVDTIDNGSQLYVTVEDMNRNLTNNADTIQVSVSSSTGDTETITLTETAVSSGIFRNTSALPIVVGVEVAANGTLSIQGANENISANYQDGDENLEIKLVKPYVVWLSDNSSTDWFSGANWVGGKVPNATDNVQITGSVGPYVSTSIEIMAMEIVADYTGTSYFYGSNTHFESLKILGGNVYVSSTFNVDQDLFVRSADDVNLYGYNDSVIGGVVDVDGVDNYFRLRGSNARFDVLGNLTVQNVVGTTTLEYLDIKGAVSLNENMNLNLQDSLLSEDVSVLGDEEETGETASFYDNTFSKNLIVDEVESVSNIYDAYQGLVNVTNGDTISQQYISADDKVTITGFESISAYDSNYDDVDFSGTDVYLDYNGFDGTTSIVATEDLQTYDNNFGSEDAALTAKDLKLEGNDDFYGNTSLTATTGKVVFYGTTNTSANAENRTSFYDHATVITGLVESNPSVHLYLSDATLTFPVATQLGEMKKITSIGTSKVVNASMTMARDEYAILRVEDNLTLDNAQINAQDMMTDDISQTGTITILNGGSYSTQGQGYFGDSEGNMTSDIGAGSLWFYLIDHDKNRSTNAETVVVELRNENGAIGNLTLMETGASTGRFAAEIDSNDISSTLQVIYEGRTLAYQRPVMTWDGEGALADGKKSWYDPLNWNENVVPLEFDSVLINSSDDTVFVGDITTIRNLNMGSGYTGTLERKEGSFKVLNFVQENGTFSDTSNQSHGIQVQSVLTVSGEDTAILRSNSNSTWSILGDGSISSDAEVRTYVMNVTGDLTLDHGTLQVQNSLLVNEDLLTNGTLSGGTLSIGNLGSMEVTDGSIVLNQLINQGTLAFSKGTMNLINHTQNGDMTQNSGTITVSGSSSFASAKLFRLLSGKYTVTNTGNVGSFGKITMDGGEFETYGHGNFQNDLLINSGKMKINSRGSNYTTLTGDITIGDYGTIQFGNNNWCGYYMYGQFRSTGTYSFGPMTYLYLYNNADFDLQNKTIEVYYLYQSGTVRVANGTLKIKNQSNSTLNKAGGSVLNLVNATLDAKNSYLYSYSGSTNLDDNSRFIRKSTGLNIINQAGNVAPHLFTFGNTMYFVLEDEGANQDTSVAETITLLYKNMTSGEEEEVILTEESVNSKKFKGSIQSTEIEFGTAAAQEDVAEGSNGRGTNKVLNFKDQMLLRYTDVRTEAGGDVFEVAFNGAKLALGSDDIAIEGNAMDFGVSYVDEYSVDEVVIYNRGDVTLVIDSMWIEDDEQAEFKFAGSGDSRIREGGKIQVAPKSQTTIGVVFEASSPGTKTGTLKIKSNDIENSTYSIDLRGVAGYRPTVVQEKVDEAAYSGNTGEAGTLGQQSVDLKEFFIGRNNQDPLNIRISGNSNMSLFSEFTFDPITKILTYTIDQSNGISPSGVATISVEATDTLGFSTQTAFGIHVYQSNNADLLKLNVVDEDGNSIGTWNSVFDSQTLSYTIQVPVHIGTALIEAESVDPNAQISITGNNTLTTGNNARTVQVISADTSVTTVYLLNLVREAAVMTGSGTNDRVFETGKGYTDLTIDESMRVNGADQIMIRLTGGYIATQDRLICTIPEGSTVESAFDSVTGRLTLTGQEGTTASEFNEVLKSVRYENYGTTATAGTRTVQYALLINEQTVDTQTRTITVNNPPTVKDQTFVHIIQSGDLVKVLNTTDKDGDTLTFELVTPPIKEADGVIPVNQLSFTYRPKNGESGLDSFVYRVYDGKSYSDFATVTVNLVDENQQGLAPLVISEKVEEASYRDNLIDAFATQERSADVSGFFEGQNNSDPLSYKLVFNSNEELFESFSFDEETGTLTYRLAKLAETAKLGTALLTFEAMDSMGYVAEATMVVQVTEAVAIYYQIGDDKDSVTGNLILPLIAPLADAITWTSSREDIIEADGTVHRPLKDTAVTMTARIERNGFYKWMQFFVTVKGTSSYDKVTDQGDLSIGYALGEDADHVKNSIYLPKSGTTGCTVTWVSSHPNVISSTGKVQRPGPDDNDQTVTLTATITDPDTQLTTTKQYTLSVLKLTDKEAAEDAARKMTISNAATFGNSDIWESVTEEFILLQVGAYNTSITWTSSKPEVIELEEVNGDLTGTVTRQSSDVNVLLTATFTKGAETATKSFLVIVKEEGITKDVNDVRVDTLREATLVQEKNGVEVSTTTTIFRTELSDGKTIDTIVMDEDDFGTLIDNMDPNDPDLQNRTALIEMSVPINDEPDEIAVEIQAAAVYGLSTQNAQLIIQTPIADVLIEEDSLKEVAEDGTDLYFRIRPITDMTEQDGLKLVVTTDPIVSASLPAGQIAKAVSTPLKIETNMSNIATKIRIPLSEISTDIPLDSITARDTFLQSLSIYVQHSDGEKKVYTPTIVFNLDGEPIALEFEILKFSTFQIIKAEIAPPVNGNGDTGTSGTNINNWMTNVPFSKYEESEESDPLEILIGSTKLYLTPGSFDVEDILLNFPNKQLSELEIVVKVSTLDNMVSEALRKAAIAQGASLEGVAMNYMLYIQEKGTNHQYIPELLKSMTIQLDGIKEKITTAILFENGAIYHQPTYITVTDGNYNAKINSFETGIFGLIWKEKTFVDVQGHWGQTSVENQAGRLVAFGIDATRFLPEQDITRAEFVSLLIRALGFAPKAASITFDDVEEEQWYSDAMSTAVYLGLIKGYSADLFMPYRTITREEAMTIIARAMELVKISGQMTEEDASKTLSSFVDQELVATWAMEHTLDCLRTGIVIGRGESLEPQEPIKRMEALIMLERLLKNAGLINP